MTIQKPDAKFAFIRSHQISAVNAVEIFFNNLKEHFLIHSLSN